MNHDELWETTMNPATRTLKHGITLDGTPRSRTASSRALMGDDVELRRQFIQQTRKTSAPGHLRLTRD